VQISGVTTTLIYLYIVPAKVAGQWQVKMPPAMSRQPATLSLKQQLTRVSGSLVMDGKEVPLEEAKLRGDQLSFRLAGKNGQYSGVVKDGEITGLFETPSQKANWSATLAK
jgi:hypothetical protein